MSDETIFALATAAGRAGVAVIRVSGPAAGGALRAMGGPEAPVPRRATRVRFAHPGTHEILDDGLAVWFPSPASFTGEDVVELHTHGGRAVVAGVLEALSTLAGLRLAEPGEFTRRAFENNKLDLTAVEGLADLVMAETAAQRRQALRQMDGALARLYQGWRETLVRSLAHLEASIDFADEDIPPGLGEHMREECLALGQEIARHLNDDKRGERLREGVQVAIIGPPNAGKSSLLNWLAQRDVAIVSPTAGTTRDVLEVWIDVGGFPVLLADTAGLRETGEEVESEGVRRARARAERADLKLAVFDGAMWPGIDPVTAELLDETTLIVMNKSDLLPDIAPVSSNPHDGRTNSGLRPHPTGARPRTPFISINRRKQGSGHSPERVRAAALSGFESHDENCWPIKVSGHPVVTVSVLHEQGLDVLLGRLEQEITKRWTPLPTPSLTRLRHRRALQDCHGALERAVTAPQVDLMAEDVRLAARALGRITGHVGVEELLDVIFRDFCIGK